MMRRNRYICISVIAYLILSGIVCISFCKFLENETRSRKIELEAAESIVQDFINACEKGDLQAFYNWQSNCKNSWKLNYISWSLAENFMVDNYDSLFGKLYYGIWEGEISSGEIFYRSEKY